MQFIYFELVSNSVSDYVGRLVGRCQPAMFRCLPRAMASSSSCTSLVIVEPAPTVAFLPIITGATKELFEPIKAPLPMMVLDLLTPS